MKDEFIKGQEVIFLALGLSIVGNCPSDRVPDHNYKFDPRGHQMYPPRCVLGDEVTGGLLDGDLVREGRGHLLPVG